MDFALLERHFEKMGARIKLEGRRGRSPLFRPNVGGFSINIGNDKGGEHFILRLRTDEAPEIQVVDVRPRERHLLLLVREAEAGAKQKFLCGHDERDWFVAAIPEDSNASTVRTAMEALKPDAVRAAQVSKGVRFKDRTRRKTKAYLRQGEWFFLPVPELEVPAFLVLRNEPLRRGRGKPHFADECCRWGGETVYVSPRVGESHPNGLTEKEYKELLHDDPSAKSWPWSILRRNMGAFVRGRVRHPDHGPLVLPWWHRVEMNTEGGCRAMRNVAFLD